MWLVPRDQGKGKKMEHGEPLCFWRLKHWIWSQVWKSVWSIPCLWESVFDFFARSLPEKNKETEIGQNPMTLWEYDSLFLTPEIQKDIWYVTSVDGNHFYSVSFIIFPNNIVDKWMLHINFPKNIVFQFTSCSLTVIKSTTWLVFCIFCDVVIQYLFLPPCESVGVWNSFPGNLFRR